MGRPTNILIWGGAVLAWTLLFALGGTHLATGNFLPAWFTSQGFNFPLNLITTVAELFIGFLVAAAANRSDRNLELTLSRISDQGIQIRDVEAKLAAELAANTALTQALKAQTDLLAEIHKSVIAGRGAPGGPSV
jgi:hypothetical protein